MRSLMGTLHDTGRATKSPRASSYGEDPRALPAIPDQLNALGLTTISEDGLASLGSQLLPVTAIVQHPLSRLHCCMLPLVNTNVYYMASQWHCCMNTCYKGAAASVRTPILCLILCQHVFCNNAY